MPRMLLSTLVNVKHRVVLSPGIVKVYVQPSAANSMSSPLSCAPENAPLVGVKVKVSSSPGCTFAP